jgi:adenosylcobinamide-GDP ribazoletransferase
MNLIRSFFVAFSMYSKIPMPKTEWTKEAMRYAMCFFPAIGLVIGGVLYLWFYLAGRLQGSLFFSAVAVLIPVVITGGIHLDGLLDTADALSSYKSREEKLEILKDSHAGAFAIIVGISYFVLYLGVYSRVTMEEMKVLAFSFVLSRALSGLAIVTFPLAKNTGLAATFSDMAVKKTVRNVLAVVAALTAAVMIGIQPLLGSVVSVAALLTYLYYYRMSLKKFGGITGDLAGFFLTVSELTMAFSAVVLGLFH